MKKKYIDINCDVGEGIGNELSLFPFITSCNIACGGHAGDITTMEKVMGLAKKFRIAVGAHPSYPDRENFGRVSVEIDPAVLSKSIKDQIGNLLPILQRKNMDLHHIKPHGALYNDVAKDEKKAFIFLSSISCYKKQSLLYVPYGSVIEELALKKGFNIKREAFGDRNYNDDLSLVSRNDTYAMITEPPSVLKHILNMVAHNQVRTCSQKEVPIKADTFCIHGDTPSALKIVSYLSKELPKHNICLKR